jgi:hypothetical protein
MLQKPSAKTTVRSISIDTVGKTNVGQYFSSHSKYDETATRDIGVSSPGYRRAIATGKNATTVLSGIKERAECGDYTLSSFVNNSPTFYIITGKHSYAPPPMEIVNPSCVQQASIQFQADAAGQMRQFDTGSFIGELGETINMIKHPLQGIGKLTTGYSKAVGKLAKGKHFANGLSNLYLEWTFGVKPLMHDIDSFINASHSIANKSAYASCRGQAKVSGIVVPHDQVHPLNGEFLPANLRIVGSSVYEHHCRIRGAVVLKNINSGSKPDALAERFGIGLDQFIPTVYNLIPFSFLVDYVSNVGDAITAVTNYKAEYSWSCTSYRITQTTNSCIIQRGNASNVPPNTGYVSGGNFNSTRTYFYRSPGVPPVGLPGLTLKLPGLHQIMNVGALIASFATARR